MLKPRYNFYATLLDSFQYYKGSDYMDKQDLLNRINRVPFEPSDAMLKGTAFHEILCLDDKKYSKLLVDNDKKGNAQVNYGNYAFNYELVGTFRKKTKEQSDLFEIQMEYVVDMGEYEVMLYGYLDWVRRNSVIDIKTTARYDFPKYSKAFQYKVYLYIANQLGYKLDTFEYLVTNFKDLYIETYNYQEDKYFADLKAICGELVDFLTHHRPLITDLKIFNLHGEGKVKV